MSVLTAHKILIASAIALFVLYSGWELRHHGLGDGSSLLRSLLSMAAAIGLSFYLRWVWIHRPGDSSKRSGGSTPAAD